MTRAPRSRLSVVPARLFSAAATARLLTPGLVTLGLVALGLVALGLAADVAAAGRLEYHLRPGEVLAAQVSAPDDVATAGFLLNAGEKTKLSISVKAAKRSELLLDVRVIDPEGREFDAAAAGGKLKVKDASFALKLKSVPTSGLWRLEVRGRDGTAGDFTATVKAKDAFSAKGQSVVGLGGSVDIPISAGDGYDVTVKAKRGKGAQLIPDIVLVDGTGLVVPTSVGAAKVNAKSGKSSLKKLRIPTFGDYSIRIIGAQATGGSVSYSLKTSPTKWKGALPVADPGSAFSVEPSLDAALDGSASTGSGALAYQWQQVFGAALPLRDPQAERPAFTAPDLPTEVAFELAVASGGVFGRPTLVGLHIAPPPIADPGPAAQLAPSGTLDLDGSASTGRSGLGLSYAWRVISGGGTLDDPASATPIYTAPISDAVARLGLVVDDGRARSREAELVVRVSATAGPVADAGRTQLVGRMATVHLSGLASLRSSDVLDAGAAWTQLSGEPVTLAGADTFTPSFTAPRQSGDLLFELRVDGEATTSHRTLVQVRPDETNTAPWTRAPRPLTAVGAVATLDASATTDPNGDARGYRWAQTAGPVATLSARDVASVTATALDATDGLWQFVVQARDAFQYGAPDFVRVRGPAQSGIPLADAGPDQTQAATATLQLSGALSVAASGQLAYSWTQATGADWFDVTTDSGFDPASLQPRLRLPPDISSLTAVRTIALDLVVTDDTGSSTPDRVNVTFVTIPRNGTPLTTASADATNPLAGTIVTLLGTAEDRDGDPVTHTWTQVSGTAVAMTPSRFVAAPRFTAPTTGTLAFDYTASDGFDTSPAKRVTVVVDAKPIAVATVTPPDGGTGTMVTFDASGSSDPEGEDVTYQWTQVFGTAATFDTTAASFTVAAPDGGFSFQLIVNDGRQDSAPVTAVFSENSPPDVAPTSSVATAAYGGSVTLRSNPSDTDGTITYTWRQINGAGTDPAVSLSSTTSRDVSFTVPSPASQPFGSNPRATFGVTATRNGKTSDEKTVTVSFYASFNDQTLSSNRRVYGIISSSCTSCHSGSNNSCPVGSGSNARGFGMATASAFSNNAIGAASCGSGKNRVQANNSSQSYLLDRMNGQGGNMPPSGLRPLAERNLIRDWIDQGASTTR